MDVEGLGGINEELVSNGKGGVEETLSRGQISAREGAEGASAEVPSVAQQWLISG